MRNERPTKLLAQAPVAVGHGENLTEAQVAAIKEFVEQVGGVENTRRAIAALQELKKAA